MISMATIARHSAHLRCSILLFFRNVREAVKATDLDKVLVVMEIDDIKCFGAMPNTIEKD